MTINKAQDQTILHMGLYLPDHVFTHGQLYMALSRVQSKDNIKILVKKGKIDGGVYTKNIVYVVPQMTICLNWQLTHLRWLMLTTFFKAL